LGRQPKEFRSQVGAVVQSRAPRYHGAQLFHDVF
jgi:hypothetical protein